MEERDKNKKKKKKPRVIHALGNIKWGFTPRGGKVEAIDTLQTKWDREHDIKMKVVLFIATITITVRITLSGKRYIWIK